MCKEMPVIPLDRVVDPKRITGKHGGPMGRRHKGLLTPIPEPKKEVAILGPDKVITLILNRPTTFWAILTLPSTHLMS
jgi:hypothetical protein